MSICLSSIGWASGIRMLLHSHSLNGLPLCLKECVGETIVHCDNCILYTLVYKIMPTVTLTHCVPNCFLFLKEEMTIFDFKSVY